MKKVLLLIMTVISFVSCSEKEIDFDNLVERNGKAYEVNSEKPYSGKISKKNNKGQFIITGHYNNGLKDKEWVEYYKNGQKSKVSNFSKNKLNGIQEFYTNKGQLVSKLKYNDGLKNGEFESFYDNGNKKSKGKYSNNNYNGLIEEWYDDSKNKLKGNFINGEYDGLIEIWYSNGKPKSVINYVKGQLNDNSKEYSTSGFLERDFNYKNGGKDGLCIVYYSEGKKFTSINYKNNKKNGLYEEWYSNNNKFKEINYKNGKAYDVKRWNKDGTIFSKIEIAIIGGWVDEKFKEANGITIFHKNGTCEYINKKFSQHFYGNYNIVGKNLIRFSYNMPSYMATSRDVWEVNYLTKNKIKFDIIERKGRNIRQDDILIKIK